MRYFQPERALMAREIREERRRELATMLSQIAQGRAARLPTPPPLSLEAQFQKSIGQIREDIQLAKEVHKYCPKYRYFAGEGFLDFSADCASGQLEPGDLGKPPQPKRGTLCQECGFFLDEPEE